jgi:ATP-dependent RNA helicase CshB
MEIKEIKAKKFVIDTLTKTKEYKEFTEIQRRVIPLALDNKNVIGKSATGSGKTDAFLVPVFNKINVNDDSLQAIIIAPTRELCAQIYQNAMDYVSNDERIKVKLFTGGFERKKDLTSGNAHLVIGTPARLKDVLVSNGLFDVSKVKTIVLDEIDMIFEMKFLEDIDVIMSLLDKEVQTLAFSATINGQLRHFISKYMQSKEIIEIGKKKESSVTITHNCVPLRGKTRLE